MNSYDSGVANRLVNVLQQYILLHFDDCKLIHKDPKINDSFTGVIYAEYQSIFEDRSGTIQLNCKKVHKYLGMTLYYYTVGQVKIIMLDYIDDIFDTFDKSDPTGGVTK